ncbi:hypothetical protein EBS80_05385 [bacterium]|nr:hypothetical protein [bacterium]
MIRIYPGERVCQVVFEELKTPLTPEEANMHGMSAAKYSENASQGFALDKDEERQALVGGTIDEMKKRFGI